MDLKTLRREIKDGKRKLPVNWEDCDNCPLRYSYEECSARNTPENGSCPLYETEDAEQ